MYLYYKENVYLKLDTSKEVNYVCDLVMRLIVFITINRKNISMHCKYVCLILCNWSTLYSCT